MAHSFPGVLDLLAPVRIRAHASLCKRLRYRPSDCARCREICPEDAISLAAGPRVDERCSGCGLCLTACPTEVFRDPRDTEALFLRQATSLLRREPAHPEQLIVRCHRAAREDRGVLDVPCLGSLSENVLVGAALAGFEGIILKRGRCSRCHLRKGGALIEDLVNNTRRLLASLALGGVLVGVTEQDRPAGERISRKELFSRIGTGLRRRAAGVVPQGGGGADGAAGGGVASADEGSRSPGRELLRRLIKARPAEAFEPVRYAPGGRWGRLRVEARRCVACGTCAAVCPTGSLMAAREKGYYRLLFSSALCTDCGLCVEACAEDAIGHQEAWSLADLLAGEQEVLATIELTSCAACGDEIRAGEGQLCSTCDRRGLSPVPWGRPSANGSRVPVPATGPGSPGTWRQ